MSKSAKIVLTALISSILSLGLVVPAVSAAPSALPVLGDSGSQVTRLQEALIARGFTLKGGADGVFTTTTQTTLKNFQKVVGFKPTGRLDERTAKFLGLIAADQPVAKKIKSAAAPVSAVVTPAKVVAPVIAAVAPVAAPAVIVEVAAAA